MNFVFAGTISSADRLGHWVILLKASRRGSSTRTDCSALPYGQGRPALVLRASEPFAFATGYFGMPEKKVEACEICGSTPAIVSSI